MSTQSPKRLELLEDIAHLSAASLGLWDVGPHHPISGNFRDKNFFNRQLKEKLLDLAMLDACTSL